MQKFCVVFLHRSVLGVPSDATDDDIRKQYRKLAVLIHPDKVHVHLGPVVRKPISTNPGLNVVQGY